MSFETKFYVNVECGHCEKTMQTDIDINSDGQELRVSEKDIECVHCGLIFTVKSQTIRIETES